MKKKLISAVLCAVMTASLVAGCGLSGGSSASSSAPAASGDVITFTMAEVNPLENILTSTTEN